MTDQPNWGPTGKTVYERTYSRVKPNGEQETWGDTVRRVAAGNLSLVYGPPEQWPGSAVSEYAELVQAMLDFKIIPAGRHLWASGVAGRQYLFNCHVAGWGDKLSDHSHFTFMRLMEGGGVGANYSTRYISRYGAPRRSLRVHIVCDPSHPDYLVLKGEGVLSTEYSHEWVGAYQVEDSREGWAAALVDLLDTFMSDAEVRHENRVYDVSRVRAEGAPLRTFGGAASGPLPFARMMREVANVLNRRYINGGKLTPLDVMEIDHEIGACVVAGGNRRSARMSIVHWDDPHILDFIACKRDTSKHWTTNISVEIDADFVKILNYDGVHSWSTRDRAEAVYAAIVDGMLTNGEPGIWNSSLSNEGEPTPVVATNPCGEIALTEFENCNLGHVNMDAFANPGGSFDLTGLAHAHKLMARFLVRATFGDVTDPRQAAVLARQRRIGVGHFGVQGFLAKHGISYSEAPDHREFSRLLRALREAVREAARQAAFELRIPEPVKVTTVAPTGTIAKLPGRTEGIHPVYARHFIRRVRYSSADPRQWQQVLDFAAEGYKTEPCQYAPNTWVVEFPTKETLVQEVEDLGLPAELVESVDEIPLERMLAFQALYQENYADNAVSFTANVPDGAYTANEVADTLRPYLGSLKGTTLMPDGTRPQAPYERITAEEYEAMTAPKTVADSIDEECASGACPIR